MLRPRPWGIVRVVVMGAISTARSNGRPHPDPSSDHAAMNPPVPSVFQGLLEQAASGPLPEWDAVAQTIALRAVEPGAALFLQDVDHPYVYAVRDGLLKLVYLDPDGEEWIKSFAEEGRFFCSLAALAPGGLTNFMATAIEPSTVERLDFRLLAALAQKHLAWSNALLALTMAFATRKETRERERLTLDAEGRYLAFRLASPELAVRLPQKDLARHLGVTPVGLSRIVTRVRRRETPSPA